MTKQIYKRTSGFTLMEIMVVIIVIAVLASVAGPMITEITESGRISATKSQFSSLRAALQAFGQDLGGLPRDKDQTGINQYNEAASTMLGPSFDNNVLVNDNNVLNKLGMAPDTYQRRWKGPYMDGNPSDFMLDAWGGEIQYIAHENSLSVYLLSYGPDGKEDELGNADNDKNPLHEDYKGDDIVLSVHRVRKFD